MNVHFRPWPAVLTVVLAATMMFVLTAWLRSSPWRLPQPTIAAAPSGTLVQPIDCWFDAGWLQRARCGWFRPSVRDSRDEHAALPFVVLPASPLGRRAERVTVYVTGGPGGSSWLDDWGIEMWREWRDRLGLDHDLVLYDQRGTGLSLPPIGCSEFNALTRQQLGAGDDPDTQWAQYETQLLRCAERLEDADRAAGLYSTATAASDLRELIGNLRTRFGYKQVSVYAVSYGTRLAIEALAEHPQLADAVVLDSPYPAGVESWRWMADDFAAILQRLERACRASSDCAMPDRDLATLLGDALDRVEREPHVVTIDEEWLPQPQRLHVDAPTLFALVEHVLFANLDVLALPQRLHEAADGRFGDEWQALFSEWLWVWLDDGFNPLTYELVECRDSPRYRPQHEAEALARHPRWQAALRTPAAAFGLCGKLGVPPQPLRPRQLQIPTLALAADLDPRTTADRALPMLSAFPQLQQYRAANASHGVVDSDDCGAQAAGDFLNSGGRSALPACTATDASAAAAPAAQ